MRQKFEIAASILLTFAICACTSADGKRIQELNNMSPVWESTLLVPNEDLPTLKTLIPLYNSYDPGLLEFMAGTKKEGDYIPEEVRMAVRLPSHG